MTIRRLLKWLAVAALALLAVPASGLLWVSVFGWNWARGPLQDLALDKTGRELRIDGDLQLAFGWPAPRLRARDLRYANPPWAAQPQMLSADAVEVTVDLRELLHGRLAFPEVLLSRPRVFLEQASGGRKTWLLDRRQTDENMRIPIGRLLLDRGEISYTDRARGTAIQATLSSVDAPADGSDPGAAARSVAFGAQGLFKGQTLAAQGGGGAVLALRDESQPYPLRVDATLGRTRVHAEGTITSLFKLSAADLQLTLTGDSLASLYPVIGIALPPTPAYRSAGHLVRSGTWWRYEKFAGQIGHSDIAGSLQVDTGGARPMLSGALVSHRLDLADLGPAVGARRSVPAAALAASAASDFTAPGGTALPPVRVLPDLPFDTARWRSLDADVTLRAQTLLRPKALPLENLQLRLLLKDARLTLDPLDFGVAGGQLNAQVTLDGRHDPLRGQVKAQLRGLMLARLLPTVDSSKTRIGRLDGDAELTGEGASVGRMLATADGRLSLVVQNGQISRLLMEQSGLHLLEILKLTLTGDQPVALRCAVADFGVTHGVMQARALVLDTAVNTLVGSGRIDLSRETYDLTVVPRTKETTAVALRSPVYIKGSFDKPLVQLDARRIAVRGAGALALGLLNPLLALIPLFEAGPGVDSECAQLVRKARAPLPQAAR